MDNKIVSIIIPTYNRAHLIGETLESVLGQTYTNWECIVVDDHSIDGTDNEVLKYCNRDRRFQYYKKSKYLPQGPSSSRNFGLSKSKGEFINWLDSDDLMHPEKLEIDLKNIQSGDYDFTISQSEFFTDDGSKPVKKVWNENLWSDDPINDFIMKQIGWGVNSPLWRKNSLKASNLNFTEDLMTADDYFYHIQALQFGLKPFVNNDVLIKLREHNQRLNDFSLKAPSKLKVNFYLLERKKELDLKEKIIAFLNKQYLNQLSNLFKKKKINLANEYLNKKILNRYTYSTKIIAYKLYVLGLLFKVTGKGYSLLNVK